MIKLKVLNIPMTERDAEILSKINETLKKLDKNELFEDYDMIVRDVIDQFQNDAEIVIPTKWKK
jgi:predicted HAD superfamily phosphohydrolase